MRVGVGGKRLSSAFLPVVMCKSITARSQEPPPWTGALVPGWLQAGAHVLFTHRGLGSRQPTPLAESRPGSRSLIKMDRGEPFPVAHGAGSSRAWLGCRLQQQPAPSCGGVAFADRACWMAGGCLGHSPHPYRARGIMSLGARSIRPCVP